MSEPVLEPGASTPGSSRREVLGCLRAPTLFYGPLVLGTPLVAVVWGAPGVTVAVSWSVGFACWTLFEYVFHRWIQHNRRIVRLIRRWDDHFEHHARPLHVDQFVYTLPETLPIAVALVGAALAVGPSTAIGLTATAGFIAGYLVFEWVHAASHSPELCEGHPWLERWAAHHGRHHWERGNAFFGFVTSFWDRVLGTCPPPKTRRADRESEDV